MILSQTQSASTTGKRSPTQIVSTLRKGFRDVTSRNPPPTCFLFLFFFFFFFFLSSSSSVSSSSSSSSSLLRSVSIAYFYYSCSFFVGFCFNFVFRYGFINTFHSALDSGSAMIWKGTVKRKSWNGKEKEETPGGGDDEDELQRHHNSHPLSLGRFWVYFHFALCSVLKGE